MRSTPLVTSPSASSLLHLQSSRRTKRNEMEKSSDEFTFFSREEFRIETILKTKASFIENVLKNNSSGIKE